MGIKEKIEKTASHIARGFSVEKYFKLRKRYYATHSTLSKYALAFRLKKMEAQQGGYVGLPAQDNFADVPTFPHGLLSVFIDERANVGKNCVIHEQVVLGRSKGVSPTIGDGCFLGAGAKIVGGVKIGDNCRIGAGTVVACSVPPNTTVVAQKPRFIQKGAGYVLTMDIQNEGAPNQNEGAVNQNDGAVNQNKGAPNQDEGAPLKSDRVFLPSEQSPLQNEDKDNG